MRTKSPDDHLAVKVDVALSSNLSERMRHSAAPAAWAEETLSSRGMRPLLLYRWPGSRAYILIVPMETA